MGDEPNSAITKMRTELADGLLILFRLQNDRVDYSFMNRPEPTLSGVDDHFLATAIVLAGREFKLVTEERDVSERVQRSDGREMTYNESIDIDWERGQIKSTRRRDLTLRVLSCVIGELMAKAKTPTAAAVSPKMAKAN